jgi:uncharacterized membrane protein
MEKPGLHAAGQSSPFGLPSADRLQIVCLFTPRNASRAYLLVLGLVALWIAGAIIAPVGSAHGWISADQSLVIRSDCHWLPDLLAVIIRSAYGRVCHQIPERSIWIQGHPMAVCARCFGIYFGFFVGLLVYPLARRRLEWELPRRRWLIFALLPMGVDFIGGVFGLFQNTVASRTALLLQLEAHWHLFQPGV